jgi:murein L,D-transpeptidase YafK
MRRILSILVAAIVLALAGLIIFAQGGFYPAWDRALMAGRFFNHRLHYRLGHQLPGSPDLARLDERLKAVGLKRGDPVFIRIFKSELTLELWMKRGESYALFASYPICYWSGGLGPKLKTGDRQAPEGFYTVAKAQLNPNSHWVRSFDTGFPNLYDREHGRTGSFLMVHGGCASVGCYAITNGAILEVWELVTAALKAGQERFAVHIFPFRLTEARLAAYANHSWAAFWRELKPGYELFEATHIPPQISVCRGRYAAQPSSAGAGAPELRSYCPPPSPAPQS